MKKKHKKELSRKKFLQLKQQYYKLHPSLYKGGCETKEFGELKSIINSNEYWKWWDSWLSHAPKKFRRTLTKSFRAKEREALYRELNFDEAIMFPKFVHDAAWSYW